MERKSHICLSLVVVIAGLVVGVGCDRLKARDLLNKGVTAYKAGDFDIAIEDFKQAKTLDPALTNARLYLATAYSGRYIPGAPSDENVRQGQQAIEEYKEVLANDANNLTAIDGIGAIIYNMAGGPPLDYAKFAEAKSYQQRHISIRPDDPEPYYWIGVIDWGMAYHANKEMRAASNLKSIKKQIGDNDPLTPALATDFAAKEGGDINEGITNLKMAIDRRPDYDDAMAYLNLMYRQKADTETSMQAHDADIKLAEELVEKVKAIKQHRLDNPPPSPTS
jgi:tetratricopeptide (TPR) repeat protein